VPTKPSLLRIVNVRVSEDRSSLSAGRRTASASSTTWRTRSRNPSALGVGTRPRPALTKSGSPVASRSLASDRLIADALRPRRCAAPTTLPSCSSTSSVTSRLRSSADIGQEYHGPRQRRRFMHLYIATGASTAMPCTSIVCLSCITGPALQASRFGCNTPRHLRAPCRNQPPLQSRKLLPHHRWVGHWQPCRSRC